MSLAIVEALFATDASRLEAWRPILHARTHVRVGNRKPAVGLTSALAELDVFLRNVRSFGARYREVWELEDATLVETDVACRSPTMLTIPCALVFRTGGGPLALDVRFYLDPGPLFSSGRNGARETRG